MEIFNYPMLCFSTSVFKSINVYLKPFFNIFFKLSDVPRDTARQPFKSIDIYGVMT